MRADLAGSESAPLLDADAAARRLGVSKSTLYSYVSRGWLHAVPDPTDPRARRYSASSWSSSRGEPDRDASSCN